jgi:hypothetical protein
VSIIDPWKPRLKAVLLHTKNFQFPTAHAIRTRKSYNTHLLLKRTQYDILGNEPVSVDSQLIALRLGCCFLYEWGIQAWESHYSQKQWSLRVELIMGQKQSVTSQVLVNPEVLLPPLHIKLASMKVFVKAKDQTCSGFPYNVQKLSTISRPK